MRLDRVQVLIPPVLLLFAACGDDENGGNEDTLFTGLSGVIILAIVIWIVVRMAKKRG